MKVYLVMGGNSPEGVFETPTKAQEFIADLCKVGGLPPSYYRVFAFDLK